MKRGLGSDALKDFSWLVQYRLQSLTRRDYDWVFVFDRDASLVVSCLWRLLEMRRILFTSLDDGQKFGLSAPVDAVAEIGSRLVGVSVEAVELRDGVLDFEIRFSTGHILQVIPDSSGHEAWHLSNGSREFIAIGGGDLAVLDDDPSSG